MFPILEIRTFVKRQNGLKIRIVLIQFLGFANNDRCDTYIRPSFI